ncbi:MAG: hypothetical protein NTX56_06955, partial [Proteobacteria bacterium]|nr:hypothetical protein [Pseudomonadota bacterium]
DMPEILIRPDDPIDRLDLRCLVDLDVFLIADEWSTSLSRVFELIQEYATTISVMIAGFDTDIGFHWVRGIGRVEFGQYHFIGKLNGARADATHCAIVGDKAGYLAAQANEHQIREAAPWLR